MRSELEGGLKVFRSERKILKTGDYLRAEMCDLRSGSCTDVALESRLSLFAHEVPATRATRSASCTLPDYLV